MKRPKENAVPGEGHATVADEKMVKKYPLILEHLTCPSYEDGTPREKSSLSIFVEDGMFKVALNDRDMKRSAYLSAETLESLFQGLEQALAKGTLDWRSWGKHTKKK